MRLVYVVQRYGAEVFGGAEQHCRLFASRMAARGHDVSVITSCAVDYMDWANAYPEGASTIDGVTVHRVPVRRSREEASFARMHARVLGRRRTQAAPFLQREWMRLQGPWMPRLPDVVSEVTRDADLTIFFTYLYFTTWAGLPAARSRTVMHPTAHDEPPIHLPLFQTVFRQADAFAFSTEEEEEFVRRRFRVDRPSAVIGIGTDLELGGDVAAFRERWGLQDRPYVVFVGRTEPVKGAQELAEQFIAFKERHPGGLVLVMIGAEVHPVPRHPDIVMTGFVDDETRDAGLRGALAMVQPSYFESFSMVLAECWAAGVPALVRDHSEVLVGHCRRSGAGIPYGGFAEFESGLELLLDDADLRRSMGERGRRYVSERYSWDAVMGRYESFLDDVAGAASP
jgi:glycosyltransferase involved in cell wall biosynthesis